MIKKSSSCWLLLLFMLSLNIYDAASIEQKIVSQNAKAKDVKSCGSVSAPCKTIPFAVQDASSGDTILIDGGCKNGYAKYQYCLNSTLAITHTNLTIKSLVKNCIASISIKPYVEAIFYVNESTLLLNLLELIPEQDFINSFIKSSGLGNISITNSVFVSLARMLHEKSTGNFDVFMQNCTFKSMHQFSQNQRIFNSVTDSIKQRSNNTNSIQVLINDSIFNHTSFFLSWIQDSKLTVNSTMFIDTLIEGGNMKQIVFSGCSFFASTLEIEFPAPVLLLHKAVFQGSGYSSLGIPSNPYIILKNARSVQITNSNFTDALYGVLLSSNSAVSILDSNFSNNRQGNLYTQQSVLDFKNSIVTFTRCNFVGNVSPNSVAGTIRFQLIHEYSYYDDFISFVDSNIVGAIDDRDTESFIVSINRFNVNEQYPLFRGHITMSCPENFQEELDFTTDISTKSFHFYCTKCDSSKYNIKDQAQISWNDSISNFNHLHTKCFPCPYEANCENGIQSKGNYWGYKVNETCVKFLPCPAFYCCAARETCTSYNTCMGNKTGRLCSDCKEHFSFSLFDHKCIRSSACETRYFWTIYICLFLVYTISFAYIDVILLYSKRTILKIILVLVVGPTQSMFTARNRHDVCTNTHRNEDAVDDQQIEETFEVISHHDSNLSSIEYVEEPTFVSGLKKILFFYYQSASIIRVDTSAKTAYTVPPIVDVISSFFNIKIVTSPSPWKQVLICPFKNSRIIIMELLKSGYSILCPFSLMICFCMFISLKKCICWMKNNKDSSSPASITVTTYSLVDSNVPKYAELPFLLRIKSSYVQSLLLVYSSIAHISLQSLKCVEIHEKSFVYIDASLGCGELWQTLVLIFVIVWVLPFALAVYVGCKLLQECKISPTAFLQILTFPPAMMFYILKVKFTSSEDDEQTLTRQEAIAAKHLLLVVNEPFRKSGEKQCKITWEALLIFRRFVLIIVSSFIINSARKSFLTGALFSLFILHHILVKPYQEEKLNIMEAISLVCLSFFTMLNIFWAFADELRISKSEVYRVMGEIFIFVELLLMTLPILVIIIGLCFYVVKTIISKSRKLNS